ncbi:DUF2207 domain-containing protein [Anaerofustis stercorihominis]|nr:DUF2207 domain-containing protein [Anaerofustis stercorihominis]MCQ4794847.1 DUF2207 domain-containing protein [Anaerofustis stercorihominis]RGD73362.1 DUF2207 domain-containing protein [Anaerofustis stercorihominis]
MMFLIFGPKINLDYNETISKLYFILADDRNVKSGIENYEISYKYKNRNDRTDDFDFFSYDLSSGEWDTSIKNLSFKIKMPKSFGSNKIYITSSEHRNNNVEYKVKNNIIYGNIKKPLKNNEILNVSITLPEGYYRNMPEIKSNDSFYVILVLSILFLLFTYFIFLKYGRDKDINPVKSFYPPCDLDPLEVGYIYNTDFVEKDFVSLIVYFAVHGYLKIKKVLNNNRMYNYYEDYCFSKVKELPDNSPEHQKIMFDGLFNNREYVTAIELQGTNIDNVYNKVKFSMDKEFGKKTSKNLMTGRRKRLYLSLVLFILSIINIFSYVFYINRDMKASVFIGILLSIACMVIFLFIIYFVNKVDLQDRIKIVGVPILVYWLFIIYFTYKFVYFINIPLFLLTCLSLFISAVFIGLVIKISDYGFYNLSRILGLKQFLDDCNKRELKNIIRENPIYFYEILPYAYVLNVNDYSIEFLAGENKLRQDWYIPLNEEEYENESICNICKNLSLMLNSYEVLKEQLANELQRKF